VTTPSERPSLQSTVGLTPQFTPQYTPQYTPQFALPFVQQTTPQLRQHFTPPVRQQFTPAQQWIDQHTGQQQVPQAAAVLGVSMISGTTAYLQESPLFDRSTALSAIDYRAGVNAVSEKDLKNAMRKALCRSEVSFRSSEQEEALKTIVFGE